MSQEEQQKSVTGSKKRTRETSSQEQLTRTGEEGSVSEAAPEERFEFCLEEEVNEKERYLRKRREAARRRRMQESDEAKATRLEKARETARRRRMQESEEAKATRLEKARETARIKREKESEEAKATRLETARIKREKESEEAKATRLKKKRETARIKRKEESSMEKEVRHKKAQKKRETTIQQKISEAKGFIEDEQQWLITGSLHKPAEFTSEEDRKKFESQVKSPPGVKEPDGVKPSIFYKSEMAAGDCQDRDKNGRHYLGKMDVICGYCGGKGFRAEIQGYFTNSDGEKLPHFGSLCCCEGHVTKSIKNYNLPQRLECLYTSDDPESRFFRENARIINNAMAMCSLRADRGWRSRTPNNKMEAMLTSGGQLIRKIGPLLPLDQQQPKCLQIYFYGAQEAVQFRMKNAKKRFPPKQSSMFELILKKLHDILMNEVHNKYLQSFLGVQDYIEKNLQDKVLDVKLCIHATTSTQELISTQRLNGPTVDEVAILLPTDDSITQEHTRYILFCKKNIYKSSLSLNLIISFVTDMLL